MTHDIPLGALTQTPAQRARALNQLHQHLPPSFRKQAHTRALQLYDRYAAGELSWADVAQTRDAAAPTRSIL